MGLMSTVNIMCHKVGNRMNRTIRTKFFDLCTVKMLQKGMTKGYLNDRNQLLVFIFDMSFQATLGCCFIVTLLTRLSYSLRFWFYMIIQMTKLWCFVFTMLTRIFYSFMLWFYMIIQKIKSCCFVFTKKNFLGGTPPQEAWDLEYFQNWASE